MARKLHWVGVPCEPLVLEGDPAEEIPALATSTGVDRVIITSRRMRDFAFSSGLSTAEQILPRLHVPACILGPSVPSLPRSLKQSGRVTLAVSLDSDIELPLSFACRLTQEHHSRLTVMHVFARDEDRVESKHRTSIAIASRLPRLALKEAELFCPLEISVREGDPADELLKHDATTRPDTIILCSADLSSACQNGEARVASRIISAARCPVMVLGRHRLDAPDCGF
jgi:nucleotide-binding universal stress UspA family protein